MKIDLFTFIAQIINFLILIFLLYYFLFKKIVKAMKERQEKMQKQIEETKKNKEGIEKEKEVLEEAKRKLENEKNILLTRARELAKMEKEKLIKEAKIDVDKMKDKWIEKISHQKVLFLSTIRQLIGKEIYNTSYKILKDLADEDLEKIILEKFIKKIQKIPKEQIEEISKKIETSEEKIIVESAFDIDEQMKNNIIGTIKNLFKKDIEILFKKSSDLALGILIKIYGFEISWNLNSFLKTIEENISKAFIEKEKEEIKNIEKHE